MQTARIDHHGTIRHAIVHSNDHQIAFDLLDGDPILGPAQPTGERASLGPGVRLLAPIATISKVVCLGKNYDAHAREVPARGPDSDVPIIFLKPSTAVIGPEDTIVLPHYSADVQLEAELAIVIGTQCRNVAAEDVERVIYGFTCANDVTARDLQRREDQWYRAKAFDTSLPLGPWIDTDIEPGELDILSRVNGIQTQRGNTRDMIHDVAKAVAMASDVATLLPGDVVLTGTPSGVTALHDGDVVEVEIVGIGKLRNAVARPLRTSVSGAIATSVS